MLGTILIVILILALFGALPRWSHSRDWGYYPQRRCRANSFRGRHSASSRADLSRAQRAEARRGSLCPGLFKRVRGSALRTQSNQFLLLNRFGSFTQDLQVA